MSNNDTINVPVIWILGEPTEHPIKDSEQGFDTLIGTEANPCATVWRYRGGFEIIDLKCADEPFMVIWLHDDDRFQTLEAAEYDLAGRIVEDGVITGLSL